MNPCKLLERFLIAKEAAGRSARTLRWYGDNVRRYLLWCLEQGNGRWSEPETVELFLASERRRVPRLAPSTVNARYRALSSWFGWLVYRKILAESPTAMVERPHVPRKRMRYVTMDEWNRLFASIKGSHWLDDRDRCIFYLLLHSGLRLSEVVNLAPSDVNVTDNLVLVRGGKGGGDREVPCAPLLAPAYVRYVLARPSYAGSELFVASDGYQGVRGPLRQEGVRQMLRRRCRAAGLPDLNPHAFRHGFAMAFLNAGMDMSAVSKAMGHSSVKVTEELYAFWLTEGLVREYNQARSNLQQKTQRQ